MIHYRRLGSVPPKHHVAHHEDGKLLNGAVHDSAGPGKLGIGGEWTSIVET
jgi:hypothetical protein